MDEHHDHHVKMWAFYKLLSRGLVIPASIYKDLRITVAP